MVNVLRKMMKDTKKVFIAYLACSRRNMEINYGEYFSDNGFVLTNSPALADYIFIISCGFNEDSTNRCLKHIENLKKIKKQNSKMVLFGCLPKINKDVIKDKDIVTIDNLDEVDSIFFSKKKIRNVGPKNFCNETRIPIYNSNFFRYNFSVIVHPKIDSFRLKIWGINLKDYWYVSPNRGCLENCTYCAIKRILGDHQSKTIEEVIREFRMGINHGYNRFYMDSDNIADFGADNKETLIDLLYSINELNGKFIIKIQHIHPRWIIENINEFERIIKKKRIYAVGVPVQSGSNRILKKMGRGYCSSEIKDCILRLNSRFPFLEIHPQFMVGFPSESEDDFGDTVKFLDGMKISPRYPTGVMEYSDMPNTPSSGYLEKVPKAVKRRRHKILDKKMRYNKLNMIYHYFRYKW